VGNTGPEPGREAVAGRDRSWNKASERLAAR